MRIPKYRKHTARDCAFIEWRGKRHYLPGPFDSFESREAYRQFLRENVLAAAAEAIPAGPAVTVAEIAGAFLDEAAKRYGVSNRSEYANVELFMRYWVRHFGELPVSKFGPRRLQAYREWRLLEKDSPGYVNSQVNRIKRAIRWAVSQEMVNPSIVVGLDTVPGLESGQEKRTGVDWKHVEPVLPHVGPAIAAMVKLQWYTAARSRSICWATPEQFDRKQQPWLWRPVHKTEKIRATPLVIPVGPNAQEAIKPFLKRAKGAPLFSPREVAGNRKYGVRYQPRSYRQAILRGIERANENRRNKIPHWFPHQLRHARAQLTRERFGAESAQAILGHESLDATEIYTSRLLSLAITVAMEMG